MLDSPTPDRKATALLLLAIAGFVDAVGLAETGRFFVSYMSGNTTELGLSLAYHDGAAALLPLGLIALFVGGAAIGTMIVEHVGRRAPGVLLIVVGGLLAGSCLGLGSARPMIGITLLPVAMGLANIVTLKAGGPQPGTTYATGALVKLGVALGSIGSGGGSIALFNLASWLALLCGSLFGGIARLRYGDEALLAPALLLLVLGIVYLYEARRRPA